MKIDNSGYIIKGIVLAICGVLFAFFPNVIAWVFYIIGGIIIIGSIGTTLTSLGGGDGGSLAPASAVGVLIGLLIMYLPKVISAHISIIAGIILLIISITQIVKALSKELTKGLKIFQLIFGIALLIGSVFLIFNPFKGGNIIRIIIGLVMIGFALFNFYVAYVINERNGGVKKPSQVSDNIVDTSGHEVHENNDHKMIQ